MGVCLERTSDESRALSVDMQAITANFHLRTFLYDEAAGIVANLNVGLFKLSVKFGGNFVCVVHGLFPSLFASTVPIIRHFETLSSSTLNYFF